MRAGELCGATVVVADEVELAGEAESTGVVVAV